MDPDQIPLEPGDAASIVTISTVAGVVGVAVRTGMPVRYASFLALVLGVAGGVAAAITFELHLLTGIVQGATVGLAAAGTYVNLSPRVHLNGE